MVNINLLHLYSIPVYVYCISTATSSLVESMKLDESRSRYRMLLLVQPIVNCWIISLLQLFLQ